jgi:hypothetical protein
MKDLPFFFMLFFLVLYDATSQEGNILWSRPNIGDSLEAIPAVDDNGNVYILAGNQLYSYTSSGEQRWDGASKAAKGGDANSVSISNDNSTVYVPGIDGIRAFDALDGSLIWSSKKNFTAKFGSVVCESQDGSTLYIGSGADHIGSKTEYIYAIDASTGSYLWRKAVDFSMWPECCRGFMAGCSIDNFGNVYLTGQNGILYSFKDDSAAYVENWTFNLGSESRMPVAIDNKNKFIYACSNSSILYKLNFSGSVLNSRDLNAGEVFAALVLSSDGHTIYVNAEDNKLHAISTLDFTEKWNYTFESWGSDPLVRNDGVIIVMGQIGGGARVCALRDDETVGTLLWSSEEIVSTLFLNETNVNIGPEGNIYVHSGQLYAHALFAIQGNGEGLSVSSPWPKVMGNIKNNGGGVLSSPKIDFTLETSVVGSGSISLNPSQDVYSLGTIVSVSATPNIGYKFDSWDGDLTGNLNPSSLKMSGNKSITANFVPTNAIWEKIDDGNLGIVYEGEWENIDEDIFYLNTAKFSESPESTLTYSFTGSQVKVYTLRLMDAISKVEITLDGVFQGEFNLDLGEEEVVPIYNSGVISEGEHILSLTNTSEELSFDYLEYLSSSALGIGGSDKDTNLFTVNVHPNPVEGNTLYMEVAGFKGMVKVYLLDVNGRPLLSDTLQIKESKTQQMKLGNFKRGLYFLKIVSEDYGSLVKKILLK